MIVHNATRIPTKILLPVLRAAKTAVGSVPTKVAVLIKWGAHVHGLANDYSMVRENVMGKKWDETKPHKYIPCQGFITLYLPYDWDPLFTARSFFSTASHEFKHVKDFKEHKYFGKYNRNWRNRPHEKRAIRTAKGVMAKFDQGRRPDWQDAVINLGIALEELQKIRRQP